MMTFSGVIGSVLACVGKSLYYRSLVLPHAVAKFKTNFMDIALNHMSTSCNLICTEDNHSPIPLPHGEPIVIGRSPATAIKDPKVSRHQVELEADCFKKEVTVKQIGANASRLGDTELTKGSVGTLREGQILYLLDGKYGHMIKFKEKQHKDKEGILKRDIGDYFGGKGKNKRTNEDGESEHHSKRAKHDLKEPVDSDSDSNSEHMEFVKQQLKKLQNDLGKSSEKPSNGNTGTPARKVEARQGPPATESSWHSEGSLLAHTSKGVEARHKIAGFDIDTTIICTQSGKVFPTHAGDWKIMYSEIPGKLKSLFADGFKIVFFTNQAGIHRGKVKVPEFKKKIEAIIAKIGIPVQVLISTGPGRFRKPGLGMWNYLINQANDGIEVDLKQSVYVGDAAGRPLNWAPGKKKDFSCSDRLFALNIGLSFFTPEEYFLKWRKAEFKMPEFDPRKLPSDAPICKPTSAQITSNKQEIIVSCGFPASGKSHFAKIHLIPKGYMHVNRDTLGSWQKCVQACQKAVKEGKSVVVDNTNPDVESRKRYLDVAQAAKVQCRCFVFNTSLQHCRHNERFREMTDKSHQPINDMIMNSFKSKYKEPTAAEGFTEIVKINFVPNFKDKKQETIYRMFLLDK